MNREDILERSRKENNGTDLVSESAYAKGNSLAGIAMVCLALIFVGAELVVKKHTNYGIFAFVSAYMASVNFEKGKQLESKRQLIAAGIYAVLTVGLVCIYILQLVGVM